MNKLGCVDTKPKTHLFGRILRILRRENLLGDSPPAFPSPCLRRNSAQKSAHYFSVNTP